MSVKQITFPPIVLLWLCIARLVIHVYQNIAAASGSTVHKYTKLTTTRHREKKNTHIQIGEIYLGKDCAFEIANKMQP